MRIPVAKDGFPIIIPVIFLGIILLGIANPVTALPFFLFGVFSIWFFRDPERRITHSPDAILSPADGKVIKIENVMDNKYLNAEAKKISIFMSIFDVHVNRIPFDGVVEEVRYNPGKFLVASLDKASESNEQNAVIVHTEGKGKYAFVQIAGLVARRIVCRLKNGDTVKRGERFGMIRFGSRLDVYLPDRVQVTVRVGEKVKAGETILGFF